VNEELGRMSSIIKAELKQEFQILKSDELMIGGYASIEMVDKQNDLITLKALNEAVKKYMENPKFRNVMTNHSNVQVGEVVESYRDSQGRLFKTEVDDVGFFVVIKLRDDIEKAKEIGRGIRKGTLRSFSIGGQALQKVKKRNEELGEYNEISKLELHEVTICEKGINPEAKFDILKQEDVKTMSKLEKALAELDTLLNEVNTLRKEEEEKPAMENMDGEEMMDESEMMAGGEYQDDEKKGPTATLDAGSIETGEPAEKIVVSGGRPTGDSQAAKEGKVSKAFGNEEFSTLNLSPENIEKAYAQFRAEQLEKLAFDNLQDTFAKRFEAEVSTRNDLVAKSEYDAQSEIATLQQQFSQLRKSLETGNEEIRKATEAAQEVKTFSLEEVADMSWSDIHKMVGGNI
jgi:HK97 family phage prohead protease|tara:strand:- start:1299 stop:2507 length:1209 start_codon:yes stop_codon:yes gene_type:complete